MDLPRSMRLLVLPLVIGVMVSCAARRSTPRDPLTDLHNPKLSIGARERAIADSWQLALDGKVDRTAVREDLKTVAWSRHLAVTLRLAAISALLSDTDERGREDTRGMVRLMLPRETEPQVTTVLARAAADHKWQEATPSLVRSLSVPWRGVSDQNRPETGAIAALNPGVPLERIVYQVFQNPPEDGAAFGLIPAERVRADAWNLLGRLDTSGTLRASLIAQDQSTEGPAADIRAGLSELRVMPSVGDELAWLSALRRGATPAYRDWWGQTAKAVALLEEARVGTLHVRHLEPIRWASEHKSEWIAATRDQLLAEVRSRLSGREFHRRTAREGGGPRPAPEEFEHWEPTLPWGDVLALLVIDEGLRAPELTGALFAQVAMDKEDRTAEYGGLFRVEGATFAPVLYPPRPGTRRGDTEFVASADMFAQGDHALAHYHFHAQNLHNGTYAGPSLGDLAYAARSGRNCLVFTRTSTDVLNVDLYTPAGAVIDLGEVRRR